MDSEACIPKYFRASAAHGRGFPRMESCRPGGILPPPQGSTDETIFAFQANTSFLRAPGAYEVTLEKKGSRWPNFIGHQAWSGGLLASESVCETLAREGVAGISIYEANFVRPIFGKLGQTDAPRYFLLKSSLEIRYRVRVSYLRNGIPEPYGSFLLPEQKAQIPPDEVGICHIHETEGLEPTENVIFGNVPEGFGCDRRVAELAFREGWTNLQLKAFDAPYLPRMSTPSAPWVNCSAGNLNDTWYTPLQAEILRSERPYPPPRDPSRRGFWGKFFGRQ